MLSSRPIQLSTDGGYISTKTPGRGFKNRIENAHAGGGVAMTVNGKGKSAFPRTPFQPSSVQPGKQRIFLTTRPLGDKTPLPNRFGGNVLFQTPLPGMSKLSKPNREGDTPDSVQRPSSMRKNIKQPRNSGGKAFETPVNNGNPWDVSDGGIAIPEAQPETTVEDEGDDLDEVEYGPPNTLDLPYEPPFDFKLPDYKEVGKALFEFAHTCHFDDAPMMPEQDFQVAELEPVNWDMMTLPAIESDDPFYLARRESLALPQTVKARIARPRLPIRGVKATSMKPVATSRAVATKPTPTAPQHQKASSVASTRSTPSASTRITSRTAGASTNPVSTSKPIKANLVPKMETRLPSARTLASNTTAHPGGKPSSTVIPRKVTEMRRPHTALAVGGASKANTKVAPYIDEVVILKDLVFGIDDDLDFKFDV